MSIHPRQSSWFDQAGFTCCASQARAFLSPGVDSRVAHGILFQVDRCVHVAVVRGLARRARPLPHAQRQDFHSVAALAASLRAGVERVAQLIPIRSKATYTPVACATPTSQHRGWPGTNGGPFLSRSSSRQRSEPPPSARGITRRRWSAPGRCLVLPRSAGGLPFDSSTPLRPSSIRSAPCHRLAESILFAFP